MKPHYKCMNNRSVSHVEREEGRVRVHVGGGVGIMGTNSELLSGSEKGQAGWFTD